MRVIINSHLDTLEQNTLQDLDDTENKIKSKIDNLQTGASVNNVFLYLIYRPHLG
jgi:hypothetical protein